MAEVICLSSDDDFEVKKPNKKTTEVPKPEMFRDDKPKKRKASSEIDTSKSKKRIQPTSLSSHQSTHLSKKDGVGKVEVITEKPKQKSFTWKSEKSTVDSSLPSTSKVPTTSNGPTLLIKEKRPVDDNDLGSEVFSQFLSLCLTKDRSPDMKKIVEKLKRRFEQTDPSYIQSPGFISLLNEKRDSLMTETSVYTHICEIHSEMKCRKKRRILPKEEETVEEAVAQEITEESKSVDRRIQLLSKAMAKCESRIKELMAAEVDWDDDDNSSYMKLAKYEEKIIKMYAKLCELTGDDYDVGRRYLKQKNLRVTGIPKVDDAIVSFMNKKFKDKRRRSQKGLSTANCVIFPDYCDILNCIKLCNEQEKLGMPKKKMEKIAQKAFSDLGNHLQKVRKDDLIDSFSLILQNASDPARENPDLLRKLEASKVAGKKNLDEIFEEFVKKQEEGPVQADANETESDADEDKDDEQEDERENLSENDDSNDLDSASLMEAENTGTVFVQEYSTDPPEVEGNPPNGQTTHDDLDEVSDSAETVIISPHRIPHRVHNLDHTVPYKPPQRHHVVADLEGTVTVPTEKLRAERWRAETLQKIIIKPGPKSSKPSIKNIENVRVVIKSHEIVKIPKSHSKPLSSGEQLPISEDDLHAIKSVGPSMKSSSRKVKKSATGNPNVISCATTSKTPPQKSEKIISSQIFRVQERRSMQESSRKKANAKDTTVLCTVSPRVKTCTASCDDFLLKNASIRPLHASSPKISKTTASTESPSRLQDSLSQTVVEEDSPSKVGGVENPEITSSTETTIEEIQSFDMALLDDLSDQVDEAALIESDSLLPDSTLQGPDVKQANDIKDVNNSEIDTRPVLKLRAFAKPPEFWNNSPDKQAHTPSMKKNKTTSKLIECINLDDGTDGTNKSSSSADAASSSSSSSSSLALSPRVPGNFNVKSVHRISGSHPTVIRILEHAKPSVRRVIETARVNILPLPNVSSANRQTNIVSMLKTSSPRPIQNTTVGSSGVSQQETPHVRINPVTRNVSVNSSADKLVNPVSMLKIMKRQ